MCAPNAPARPRSPPAPTFAAPGAVQPAPQYAGAPPPAQKSAEIVPPVYTDPTTLPPTTGGPSSMESGPNGPQWGAPPPTLVPPTEVDTSPVFGSPITRPGRIPPATPPATMPGNIIAPRTMDIPTPGGTAATPPPSPVDTSPVVPGGANPNNPATAPASLGHHSSTTSLLDNSWAEDFARKHPELQGSSISPFDYGLLDAQGNYNGPALEAWTSAHGYTPGGFSGIKDGGFWYGGAPVIGGVEGWNQQPGSLAYEDAWKNLRSQFRAGIPTLGGGNASSGATPITPPTNTPVPAATRPAQPVTTNPGQTVGTTQSNAAGPGGTTQLVETPGQSPISQVPPTNVASGAPKALEATPIAPLVNSFAAPKVYMPQTMTGGNSRSAIAQALARRFNPQLWA